MTGPMTAANSAGAAMAETAAAAASPAVLDGSDGGCGGCVSAAAGAAAASTGIEIPSRFVCPITLQVMVHPLMTRTGQSFERSAILSWLERGTRSCPLTRNPMGPRDLIPNSHLEAEIKFWRRSNGIPEPSPEDLALLGNLKFVGFLSLPKVLLERKRTTAAAAAHHHHHHASTTTVPPPPPALISSILVPGTAGRRRSTDSSSDDVLPIFRNAPMPPRRRGGAERQRSRRRHLSRLLTSAMEELDNNSGL